MASLSVPGTVKSTKVYSITGFHSCNNKHMVTSAKYKPCLLCVCCRSHKHTLCLHFALTETLVGAQGLLLKDKACYILYFYVNKIPHREQKQKHVCLSRACLCPKPICFHQCHKSFKINGHKYIQIIFFKQLKHFY